MKNLKDNDPITQEEEKKKEQEAKERAKERRKTFIQALLIALLLLLLILFGLKGCTSAVVPDTVKQMFNVGIDDDASQGGLEGRSEEEIIAELNEKVAASMINISMNTTPTFADGSSEGNVNIVNNTVNNYAQVIEIYLQDEYIKEDGSKGYEDKDLIYQSGKIPVGSKVVNAKLNKALESGKVLEKGTYQAIAYFNAVKDDGEYVGKAAARIKIVIEN